MDDMKRTDSDAGLKVPALGRRDLMKMGVSAGVAMWLCLRLPWQPRKRQPLRGEEVQQLRREEPRDRRRW